MALTIPLVFRAFTFPAGVITLSMFAAPARADDRTLCYRPSADTLKLEACARLIRSGRVPGRDIAYAYQQRGAVLASLKQFDNALTETNEAIRLAPHMWEAYYVRCGILFQLNHFEHAIPDCTEAIQHNSKHPDSYYARGLLFIKLGRNELALADLNTAIRIKPQFVFLSTRGLIYIKIEEFDRAIADLDHAIRLAPTDSISYSYRAVAYEGRKDFDQATADYQKALRLDPSHPGARDGLARIENRKAAQAALDYGALYFSGNGVPRDLILAYRWYNAAAAFLPTGPEREKALASRDAVARQMSSDELVSAQKAR